MAAKRNGSILDNNAMVSEPREPRRTSFSYIVFSLFVTLLGLAVLAGASLLYGQRQFEAKGPLTVAKTAVVKSGQGGGQIAETLAAEGIISNQRIFHIASAIYHRLGRTLKAGEYSFKPGDSMQAVFDQISAGKGLSYKITIPEGWTSQQALQRLRDNEVLTGDVPVNVGEGVLLPDTYAFQRGDSRAQVIERMQGAQSKLLKDLWDKRELDLPIKSIDEALILASIVEKETGVSSERSRVAAVFINRLRKGMRLQSDPTIIYGIVGGKGKLGRPIKRSEINAKTAYNTYQIDGLPPTPIANPGKLAIQAVLQPDKTEELYFVADGSGGHVFARTLAEHNANVKNYRKIERAERAAAATLAAQQPAVAKPEPVKPEPVKTEAAKTDEPAQPEPAKPEPAKPEPAKTVEIVTPAVTDQTSEPIVLSGDELPMEVVQQNDSGVATTGKIVGKIPLPRPRPVTN